MSLPNADNQGSEAAAAASAVIEVRYLWSLETLTEGRRVYNRHKFGLFLLAAVPVFFALMLGGGLAGLIWGTEFFRLSCILGVAAGLSGLVVVPWLQRLGLRSLFSKRPDKDIETRWSLSENHVVGSTVLGVSDHSWAAFSKALFASTVLILMYNETMFIVMPRSGFQNDEDFESAKRLVKAKVPATFEVG